MSQYEVRRGDLTMAELLAAMQSGSLSAAGGADASKKEVAGSNHLKSKAEGLPVTSKMGVKVVQQHLNQLNRWRVVGLYPQDFLQVAPCRDTRAQGVITLVDKALHQTPHLTVEERGEIINYCNSVVNHQGTEEGMFARFYRHGNSTIPTTTKLKPSKVNLSDLRAAFPLNEVHNFSMFSAHYSPDLSTSRGLPNPEATKRSDLTTIMAVMGEIERTRSFAPLTSLEDWATAVISLKRETRPIDSLKEKSRMYSIYRAEAVLGLGGFMSHFTNAIPTIFDGPNVINMVGVSFMWGGAGRLFNWLKGTEELKTRQAVYADDQLLTILGRDGLIYTAKPDVSYQEANAPHWYFDWWINYLVSWVGAKVGEDDTERTFARQGIETYAHLHRNARHVFPRGVLAEGSDMAFTGMTGNSYFETFISVLNHAMFYRTMMQEAQKKLAKAKTTEKATAILAELQKKIQAKSEELLVPFKPDWSFEVWDGRTIKGVLGQDFIFYEDPKRSICGIGQVKAIASLLNPNTPAKTPAGAILIAYGRCIALCIATGGMSQFLIDLAHKLFKEAKEVLKTQQEGFLKALAGASYAALIPGSELSDVDPDVLVQGEGGSWYIRSPPDVGWYKRLRRELIDGTRVKDPAKRVNALLHAMDVVDVKGKDKTKGEKSGKGSGKAKGPAVEPLVLKGVFREASGPLARTADDIAKRQKKKARKQRLRAAAKEAALAAQLAEPGAQEPGTPMSELAAGVGHMDVSEDRAAASGIAQAAKKLPKRKLGEAAPVEGKASRSEKVRARKAAKQQKKGKQAEPKPSSAVPSGGEAAAPGAGLVARVAKLAGKRA